MQPVFSQPWAIVPERLAELKAAYDAAGPSEACLNLSAKNIDEQQGYDNHGGVAVVHLDGVLTKSGDFWYDGTAMNEVKGAIRSALDDPSVHSIVLHIDSPGGTVDGTQGLASAISSARGEKPITAYSDGMMASAAYWIGSAADKIYISGDTVEVGSIGVVAAHVDVSRLEENIGVKVTEITAGKYKRIASAHAPLSDEGRSSIQDKVDQIYGVFVEDVAKHRNVSVERALEMADGKLFIGRKAVDVGLVDGIATLEEIITDLKEDHMTREEFAAKFPADYQAILEEGRKSGFADGLAQGKQEGAEAERERIRGVESQSLPGHEALIESMKYDGRTTGEMAAVAILAAERKQRENALNVMVSQAPPVIAPATPPMGEAWPEGADDQRPLEIRAKESWDNSRELRAEFGENFGAYLAFERASAAGRVRILRARA
jgi:capsid assembly protease